ncbi:6-bladed beta-propeller [Roseivirga sp.]|uniref:6-bladed beta-propeller n=1 Tax=Roseivirga sp. TaxID=1964215 RepID=UPI003B8E627A
MSRKIIIYFLSIACIACQTKQDSKVTFELELNNISENHYDDIFHHDLTTIPNLYTNKKIESSDLYKHNITYIPLETNDESLFADIYQLLITDKAFIILDKKSKAILVFSHSGKFKFKIQRIGGGPEEYKIPKIVAFNKFSNSIEVLDNTRGVIQRYNADTGAYKSTLRAGFTMNSFFPIAADKYLFHIDSYLFNDARYGQVNGLEKQLLIAHETDKNGIKIISQHVNHIKNSGLLNFGSRNYLRYGADNDILISSTFNDTIYSFSQAGVRAKFVLDFGKDRIPSNFFPKSDFNKIKKRKDFDELPTPDSFWETRDFTYNWGTHQNRIVHSFYSKKRTKSITVFNSDFMQAAKAVGYRPIGANDTALVFKMEPQEVHILNNDILQNIDKFLERQDIVANNSTRDSLYRKFIDENGYHFLFLSDRVDEEDNQILAFIQPNFEILDNED